MGWLFVPGLADLSLESDSQLESPTGAFATSSGKPSLRPCSWPGWKTRPWNRLLSSMTFSPSTLTHGAEKWISSLPGSPANRGALPDREKEQTTSDGSGLQSQESFGKWDPDSCSWRTSQGSLWGGQGSFSGIWPRSGSMRSGECFQPPESERPTSGNASSFWRSPEGSDGEGGIMEICDGANGHYKLRDQASTWPTPKASDPKVAGNNLQTGQGMGLEKAARFWETPKASEGDRGDCPSERNRKTPSLESHALNWSTPTARDYKNPSETPGGRVQRKIEQGWTPDLGDQVARFPQGQEIKLAGASGMVLNPRFVEALMGWPSGWTEFESLGTAWSRWLRLMRSELLRLGRES